MSDFKVKGHLAMLGANVMWGLMAPIVKIVLASGVVAPPNPDIDLMVYSNVHPATTE